MSKIENNKPLTAEEMAKIESFSIDARWAEVLSIYGAKNVAEKYAAQQTAAKDAEIAKLREEMERERAILAGKLIGEKEGNALAASEAYYEIADLLDVREGDSVIESVEALQTELETVKKERDSLNERLLFNKDQTPKLIQAYKERDEAIKQANEWEDTAILWIKEADLRKKEHEKMLEEVKKDKLYLYSRLEETKDVLDESVNLLNEWKEANSRSSIEKVYNSTGNFISRLSSGETNYSKTSNSSSVAETSPSPERCPVCDSDKYVSFTSSGGGKQCMNCGAEAKKIKPVSPWISVEDSMNQINKAHENRILSKIALISGIFANNRGAELSDIIIKISEQVVKWEAEMFEAGFEYSNTEPIFLPSNKTNHMVFIGLIPSPEKQKEDE